MARTIRDRFASWRSPRIRSIVTRARSIPRSPFLILLLSEGRLPIAAIHRDRCALDSCAFRRHVFQTMDKDDEREWKETVYIGLVTDGAVRAHAWNSAQAMHGDNEPALQLADLEIARTYLKKCVTRMSVTEIKASGDETFAALWAKGTVGAAKYRVRGAK